MNREDKKKIEEHLYNLIFDDGFRMLSSEFNSIDFHAMTHENTEILGMFCDYTGIHGEKLKDILIKGYMSEVARESDHEDVEWVEENEDLQDATIRAARKAHFSRIKAKEVFENKGILGIYNLGMKHMYDYLLNRIGE